MTCEWLCDPAPLSGFPMLTVLLTGYGICCTYFGVWMGMRYGGRR